LGGHPTLKESFYHFSSLLGMMQYELLFEYTDKLSNQKKQLSILDWGCGNGWFSYYLLWKGFSNVSSYGYGWDNIANEVSTMNGFNFVDGSVESSNDPTKLPFEDNSQDIVFSVGVLEHVHETGGNQINSLREIYRILKPGGVFFCYHFPNKYTWIEFLKGMLIKGSHVHSKKFNKKEIVALVREAELQLDEVKRYQVLPYNLYRKSRLDGSVLAVAYRFVDKALSKTPFGLLSQCYLFVAKK
jgi:SAM-dependent methyltransferase